MHKLIAMFNKGKTEETPKYKGLSDFVTRAPAAIKREVFYKAAQMANEDQMQTYKRAQKASVN